MPEELVISMRQHRGPAAQAVVEPGMTVTAGELIAESPAADGTDIHAPAAGTIIAIETRDVPVLDTVQAETCIVMKTAGDYPSCDATRGPDPSGPEGPLISRIAAGGIVGLGGAAFPTAHKLRAAPELHCDLLIINGAECEPYISCDDRLMQEAADEILDGAGILKRILAARKCIIAIERDKPVAIDAMTLAAERSGVPDISVAELPSIYPAGGERQLGDVLAHIEVPSSRYPSDLGILCQNVGTAFAVHRLFRFGEPLTRRIVTVTGSGVAEPRNVDAMIGTSIRDLIEACGGYRPGVRAVRLIHGGSMMGFALENDAMPISKSTNCLIVAEADEVRTDNREWPCIRCGECSIACPARLQPQDLLIAARASDGKTLDSLCLEECIECGCCDIVCPSHIPLTNLFRESKSVLQALHDSSEMSHTANERYRAREQRRNEIRQSVEQHRMQLKNSLGNEEDRARVLQDAVKRARRNKPDSQ